MSQVDHETVQATALKVVFDLLHVYGFEAFNIGAPGEPASAVKTSTGDEQAVSKVIFLCSWSYMYMYMISLITGWA